MVRTITKAMIAEIFMVSRSAVVQSTKTKSTAQDLKARIIRYLSQDKDMLDPKYRKQKLLEKADDVLRRRNLVDATFSRVTRGRPITLLNFQRFMKIVEKIYKQLRKKIVEHNFYEKEYESILAVRLLYSLNDIQNRRWKIPVEELLI